MTSIAPDELPSEVLALALSDAAPLTSLEPKARRLSMLAENHSCSGGWVAVEEILGDRPGVAKRLRQAGLTGGAVNYDPAFGSALIAVGRTKRFDNPRPAWFAVVGGDVLRHRGARSCSAPARMRSARRCLLMQPSICGASQVLCPTCSRP